MISIKSFRMTNRVRTEKKLTVNLTFLDSDLSLALSRCVGLAQYTLGNHFFSDQSISIRRIAFSISNGSSKSAKKNSGILDIQLSFSYLGSKNVFNRVSKFIISM